MSYPQQQRGGYDRSAAPAAHIDTSDVRFGANMPELLFADIAQEKARTIAQAGGGRKNKSTQLRKFYDELVMWQEKIALEQNPERRAEHYKEHAPFIKMLSAKVAYARGREHVDPCFEKLFTHVIRQIDSPETLKHAKLFMEAFMGFYKAEEK
ncbi:type III-A CRISPR-associated protein Csm2 [Azovibrio restrictus]|uniref:type III-A CRISPR-associated protein Csm2 n=1 Tax=Azovibrio restrictus TaxID=146938 RepID=UPI0026EF7918|nr:type III-A CRISPR-associated protein Csm2 [Azovibrio restrictus]